MNKINRTFFVCLNLNIYKGGAQLEIIKSVRMRQSQNENSEYDVEEFQEYC